MDKTAVPRFGCVCLLSQKIVFCTAKNSFSQTKLLKIFYPGNGKVWMWATWYMDSECMVNTAVHMATSLTITEVIRFCGNVSSDVKCWNHRHPLLNRVGRRRVSENGIGVFRYMQGTEHCHDRYPHGRGEYRHDCGQRVPVVSSVRPSYSHHSLNTRQKTYGVIVWGANYRSSRNICILLTKAVFYRPTPNRCQWQTLRSQQGLCSLPIIMLKQTPVLQRSPFLLYKYSVKFDQMIKWFEKLIYALRTVR